MISIFGVDTSLLAELQLEIFMGVTIFFTEDSPAVKNLLTSYNPNKRGARPVGA
jgi:hypothetical protein